MMDRTAILNAPAGASLDAALVALAALVEEFLTAFDAGFAGHVVTHLDASVILSKSRRERIATMGDPARYAEVFRVDQPSGAAAILPGAGGEAYASARPLGVVVYYGLPARAEGPGADDTAAMRRLIEGEAGTNFVGVRNALPGLRPALAAQGYLAHPTKGTEMLLDDVRLVALRPATVEDGTGVEWRHEALITLTVSA